MNNNLFQDHPFDITTIDTGFIRPHFAASHLLIEDHHGLFIDVGSNFSMSRLLTVLQEKNIPRTHIDYIVVTHVHLDHAGGAGQLIQALPNAQLVVHPRGARHLIDPQKLIAGATAVYGEAQFKAHYGDIVPIPAHRVIEAADEYVLDFRGRPLLFLDTPGHARHHNCIFDERSHSFFSGDTFGLAYPEFNTEQGGFIFATTTPVQFEPLALHHSIDRLLSYQPQNMYLTHYGAVTEVTQLAEKLHQSIDEQVLLMEAVADEPPAHRHDILFDRLMTQLLDQLQQHGCNLPTARCRQLLATDVELNVQGLQHWWAHNS